MKFECFYNEKATAEKIQNSGKFQNNAINDIKQISLSHVSKLKTNKHEYNQEPISKPKKHSQ